MNLSNSQSSVQPKSSQEKVKDTKGYPQITTQNLDDNSLLSQIGGKETIEKVFQRFKEISQKEND